MFSKSLSFILSFFLLACAKPNYQNTTSNFLDNTKESTACPLPLLKLNQCVSLTWIQPSTESQMGIFSLNFSANLVGDVSVILWMPSMGHGSRPTSVIRLNETDFQVSNVAFIMPGEWEIRIRVSQNNQVTDEVAQKIIY